MRYVPPISKSLRRNPTVSTYSGSSPVWARSGCASIPSCRTALLDVPPDEEYTANSFVIRRWKARGLSRDSFDGATVRIEGLEHTITDALVNVSFLSGQQIQTVTQAEHTGLQHTPHGDRQNARAGVSDSRNRTHPHWFRSFELRARLVLLVRGRVRLLKTITAFTLAHSITLAIAALGYVHVSAPVIESLVALSIVFVAVELTRAWQGNDGITTQYPWLIAFTFGLLHGFAFAGSLADIGLPSHNIPGAAAAVHCGVEVGQLLSLAPCSRSSPFCKGCPWGRSAVVPAGQSPTRSGRSPPIGCSSGCTVLIR